MTAARLRALLITPTDSGNCCVCNGPATVQLHTNRPAAKGSARALVVLLCSDCSAFADTVGRTSDAYERATHEPVVSGEGR